MMSGQLEGSVGETELIQGVCSGVYQFGIGVA
jgi:hypothetical protein